MAGEGAGNVIVRRVTDDLIAYNGESSPSKYIKFFLEQKLSDTRRFMNWIRVEVATSRECLAQLTALVADFEAMENQDEVHDSLLAAKDARRCESAKFDALNEVMAEAMYEIETLESNVEILDDAGDDAV
ncbi:hypothetical protein Tco_1299779 [Tanacetum coccineum]